MAAWRTLGVVVVVLASARVGWGQTYTLSENLQAGDCFRVHLDMKLSGQIKVHKDEKAVVLKQEATAVHEFPERVLNVGAGGLPEKTARVYEQAKASIAIDRDRSERVLRPARSLIVAQRYKDQPLAYCPVGALMREELELTGEHFDTLCLTGLLPGKAVAVGETWNVTNAVAQALCGFEGLTAQTLVCKLEAVEDQVARVSVAGTATGIDTGALAKLTIEASYQFSLKAGRLTQLVWQQKDERDQGPASPATSMSITTSLTRTPIDQPASLSDEALVSVPEGFTPPVPLTQLEHHDPKGRFDLVYSRDWQSVAHDDEHLVLRLVERGDFVGQVTLTPWTKAEKGKHLTPEEFHQAMDQTPGWEAEQELQAGEVPADRGRWIYRISALGKLDGSKVMQNFYLVAGPEGDQVVLVFTMTPKEADRLGTRDLSLASSVELPGGNKDAKKP
jgi:hypothetical protein